jgi:hypothetical protein
MSVRLLYEVVSGDYPKMMKAAKNRIAKTATATMKEAANLMKTEGRAAMGGMSSRFKNALRSKVYPSSGISLSPAAVLYSKIPWAGVFEDGATISGHPMLWLPIEANLPLSFGKHWTPKDFAGPLRSGNMGGKPVLFGQVKVGLSGGILPFPTQQKGRHGERVRARFSKQNGRMKWLPVFVGVSNVTDPKKFDITAVVAKVSDQLGEIYSKNWDASKNG